MKFIWDCDLGAPPTGARKEKFSVHIQVSKDPPSPSSIDVLNETAGLIANAKTEREKDVARKKWLRHAASRSNPWRKVTRKVEETVVEISAEEFVSLIRSHGELLVRFDGDYRLPVLSSPPDPDDY